MSDQNRVMFRLYREGEEMETLEVPGNITVKQLGELHQRYDEAGFTVMLNGRAASREDLEDIATDMRRRGTSIRIGTERASMDSLIPNRSVVTMSGEQKGGTASL